MNLRNIAILISITAPLLVFVLAALIVNAMYLAPATVTAMYVPEALSHVE